MKRTSLRVMCAVQQKGLWTCELRGQPVRAWTSRCWSAALIVSVLQVCCCSSCFTIALLTGTFPRPLLTWLCLIFVTCRLLAVCMSLILLSVDMCWCCNNNSMRCHCWKVYVALPLRRCVNDADLRCCVLQFYSRITRQSSRTRGATPPKHTTSRREYRVNLDLDFKCDKW